MTDPIEAELQSLAEDLYTQGYGSFLGEFGHTNTDLWMLAYAKAFKRISAGEPYSSGMVVAIHKELDS